MSLFLDIPLQLSAEEVHSTADLQGNHYLFIHFVVFSMQISEVWLKGFCAIDGCAGFKIGDIVLPGVSNGSMNLTASKLLFPKLGNKSVSNKNS